MNDIVKISFSFFSHEIMKNSEIKLNLRNMSRNILKIENFKITKIIFKLYT
jgi:hypothetical protein